MLFQLTRSTKQPVVRQFAPRSRPLTCSSLRIQQASPQAPPRRSNNQSTLFFRWLATIVLTIASPQPAVLASSTTSCVCRRRSTTRQRSEQRFWIQQRPTILRLTPENILQSHWRHSHLLDNYHLEAIEFFEKE